MGLGQTKIIYCDLIVKSALVVAHNSNPLFEFKVKIYTMCFD